MSEKAIADLIKVRGRFQRSVHLTRDWHSQRGLQDYLLTSTAREITKQVLQGISHQDGLRTWSITGPYGTGKSAFALFLTDLLVNNPPTHPQAKILRNDILNGKHSFLPILVVGERDAMAPAFLRALGEGLRGVLPSIARKATRAAKNDRLSNTQIVELFEQAAQMSNEMGYGGILFIVDEFGKFLEFATHHPEIEDLLILQNLAETAARSQVPIVFLTILHSAFAEYLDFVDETRRLEWQKVHGRFADVAFLEPPEQFLHLIGEAIEWKTSNEHKKCYEKAVETLVASPAFDEAKKRFKIKDLLSRCAPLHAITALLLWPLFRSKLAQNERSLFAFLNDRGPFGFQEFLGLLQANDNEYSFYTIDRLYDYVRGTLGTGMLLGDRASRWAEIEHAIDRVDTLSPPSAKAVVKCIGLLGLYGRPVGLRASKATLEIALGDRDAVTQALKYLEDSSIAVYRRYEDAFALWEGSDANLDVSFNEALNHVGHGNLANRLKKAVTLQPVVARAHYIRTGTLRYFEVDVIDNDDRRVSEVFQDGPEYGDGKLTFVVSSEECNRRSFIKLAQKKTKGEEPSKRLQVLAFPKPVSGLEETLQTVEAWTWVKENVHELQGDPVARREVTTRINHARRRLEMLAGTVLGLRGYPFEPTNSDWVQGGALHKIGTAIEFTKWISSICDDVFHHAPPLNNELINRENLSSSATAARRNLIEAMLNKEDEHQLGIRGNPAELTMYRALLQAGGFHRKRKGLFQFGPPSKEWQPVWTAMKSFLKTTRTGRRPLVDLITELKEPPLGLREGPIPVLLTTLFLAHRDQVALYEDGVFVPELRIEIFERLMRVPSAFEVQQYQLNKRDQEAFEAIGEVLGQIQLLENDAVSEKLLDVVKPLVLFAAGLPAYTKRTKHIEPVRSVDVRDVLLKACDPYVLLFEELPTAIGISIQDRIAIQSFANKLRACLQGLQRVYPRLLDQIELQLREVLYLGGNSISARDKLKSRAEPLLDYALEPGLSLFLREASRLDNSRDWREVMARAASQGRPPTSWTDADAVQFQARLRYIASDLMKLEELVAEQGRVGAGPILRIGLLHTAFSEARAIVSIPNGREQEVDELAQQIIQTMEDKLDSSVDGMQVRIAALARVAERYLRDKED